MDGATCLSCGLRHVLSVSKSPCEICRLRERAGAAEKEHDSLRKRVEEDHICAVYGCKKIQEGAVHMGAGIWIQFCRAHHDLFRRKFTRVDRMPMISRLDG